MSDLFVRFYMLKIDIERAISENRMDVATRLRQDLFSLWKSIVAVEPETIESKKMLGLFLMDQLTEKTPEYEVKLIRRKLIELFWETPQHMKSELLAEKEPLRVSA